jgi:hypothetical protein
VDIASPPTTSLLVNKMLRVFIVSGYLFSFCLEYKKETKILIRPLAEIKSQICCPPHIPGHGRIWLGPTRRLGTQLATWSRLAVWQWHQLFFQLLVPITIGKQPNFVFGLVRVCADKILLRSKSAAMRLRSYGASKSQKF